MIVREQWEAFPGNVHVRSEGSDEPARPDFVLAPAGCHLREGMELLSSGLIMVAKVVSGGSARRDRDELSLYVSGNVPIYLLIDVVARPATVTVYSDLDGGVYRTRAETAMGKPLRLPQPVGFELDTSIFMV